MAEKETKSCSEECEEMTDNEIIKALDVCAYSDACLKECPFFNYKAGCIRRLTASALEIIKRHQSDVEPVKHGHWYNRGGRFRCSVCDNKALLKDIGGTGGWSHEYEQQKSPYCPNCGAKMDGE